MAARKDRTQTPSKDEDPFLARWARRKQAVQQGEPAPSGDTGESATEDAREADEAGAQAPADAAAADEPSDEAELAPPESLGPDSDFSAYLSRRVSSGLRRAALRRLFSLPGFNVRDGLDDYDEDYTNFAALGNTVTADMKYHAERLRARDAEAETEDGPAAEGGAGEPAQAQHDDADREPHRDARDDPEEDTDDRA